MLAVSRTPFANCFRGHELRFSYGFMQVVPKHGFASCLCIKISQRNAAMRLRTPYPSHFMPIRLGIPEKSSFLFFGKHQLSKLCE